MDILNPSTGPVNRSTVQTAKAPFVPLRTTRRPSCGPSGSSSRRFSVIPSDW